MKVKNMTSSSGNKDANQFIITNHETTGCQLIDGTEVVFFQSYDSVIVKKCSCGLIELDHDMWDYSRTTGKYRNIFLGETKAETQKKIDSGEYILTDLN